MVLPGVVASPQVSLRTCYAQPSTGAVHCTPLVPMRCPSPTIFAPMVLRQCIAALPGFSGFILVFVWSQVSLLCASSLLEHYVMHWYAPRGVRRQVVGIPGPMPVLRMGLSHILTSTCVSTGRSYARPRPSSAGFALKRRHAYARTDMECRGSGRSRGAALVLHVIADWTIAQLICFAASLPPPPLPPSPHETSAQLMRPPPTATHVRRRREGGGGEDAAVQ
eukprot:1516083-Rhodomonas_salina.3